MARAGSSTLLVEANAMSEGLADAEWVASWIGLAKELSYDMRKRDLLNREFKITSIMSTEDETQMNLAAITDAKSMYDNLVREQYSGAEKRAALELCMIKDSLDSLGGKARWVPHEENPVDCMTKIKGNAVRMLELLRTGKYRLTAEAAELEKRREYREQSGRRNPRPNRFTETAPKYVTNRQTATSSRYLMFGTDMLKLAPTSNASFIADSHLEGFGSGNSLLDIR
jgi:hypothetical protein